MFEPRCAKTLIGSLPHTDPEEAVRLVMEHLDEIPIFPELPRRGLLEEMIGSHTQGLPGLVVDREKNRLYIDRGRDLADELASFYERVMEAERTGNLDSFAIDAEHLSGIGPATVAMERKVKEMGRPFPLVKVHVPGPVTFQLGLEDHEGRQLYYDETFADVLLRQIEMQARWLVRRFRPYGERVLIFLDEAALAAFGSSGYLGVLREDVVERLGLVVRAIKTEPGTLVGIHVCGGTDWPMVMEAGFDMLNFDAFSYSRAFLAYSREIRRFLDDGGLIAWGIVPSSHRVDDTSAEELAGSLLEMVDQLAAAGPLGREVILARSVLTPSCGLGTLTVERAKRALELLDELASHLQPMARS
ncbi:MAG: hypothetical protein D6806_18695 [Deltaproteobacteria bacterium]|nr:MAG: hypothetical protein D6806_18695 [Deltaproteobacteria bacterium]